MKLGELEEVMKLISNLQAEARIKLNRDDITHLSNGGTITQYMGGIDVKITGSKESPLEYLERTWNEPRYGETPLQHFNRIHGVSE